MSPVNFSESLISLLLKEADFDKLTVPIFGIEYIPEDLKEQIKDGMTVEYWNVEGRKFIKRSL